MKGKQECTTVKGEYVEGTTQYFTFRYKVESPVKVQGLSSQWAQKKTVLVTCDASPGCSDIFYKLMTAQDVDTNKGECPTPTGTIVPITLKSTYCQVIKGELTNCNFGTEAACNLENDQNANQPMNEAQLALQTAIENGLAPDQLTSVINQFSAAEPESSSYT